MKAISYLQRAKGLLLALFAFIMVTSAQAQGTVPSEISGLSADVVATKDLLLPIAFGLAVLFISWKWGRRILGFFSK